MIHRDLKPSNIMIGRFGEVQVMDWGLAKVMFAVPLPTPEPSEPSTPPDPETMIRTLRTTGSNTPLGGDSLTKSGSIMGTPAYMPPEQALGQVEQLDERADVFGLGAILCEILSGCPPYVGASSAVQFRLAAMAKLDDCRSRLEDARVDPELTALVMDCLAPDLSQRIRDGGEVVKRLAHYLRSVEDRLRQAEMDRAAESARAEEALKTACEAEEKMRAERRSRRLQLGIAMVILAFSAGGIALVTRFLDTQKRQTAEVQSALTEKSDTLYVAHMQMADHAWRAGAVRRVRELLDAHLPVDGGIPLVPDDERKLTIVDINERRDPRQVLLANKIRDVDWRGDDRDFIVALDDGTIEIWDAETGQRQRELDQRLPGVRSLAVADDDRYVVVANRERIEIIDLDNDDQTTITILRPSDAPELVGLMPLESTFATSSKDRVTLWDYRGRLIRQVVIEPGFDLARSPSGRYLATYANAHIVSVFAADTGERTRVIKGHHNTVYGVDFMSDGRICTGGRDGMVRQAPIQLSSCGTWSPARLSQS